LLKLDNDSADVTSSGGRSTSMGWQPGKPGWQQLSIWQEVTHSCYLWYIS